MRQHCRNSSRIVAALRVKKGCNYGKHQGLKQPFKRLARLEEFIMSKFYSLSQVSVAPVAATSLVAMLALAAPQAPARKRKATITGANGPMATRAATRSAEGGTTTTTGPDGKTRSRSSARDGEGSGTTTFARANGGTVTREVTLQP